MDAVLPLFGSVMLASLAGSLHCAGMCGGLVALYAPAELSPKESRGGGHHALYHGGRLVTYVALGALAGALGGLLEVAGTLVGVAKLAATVAGAGVAMFGAYKLYSLYEPQGGGSAKGVPVASALVGRLFARLSRHPPAVRALALGLGSGLLPCGWLYAFIAVAGGTASALLAAGVMAAFWLGTVPALAAVGFGIRRLAGPLAARLPAISAVVLIVVGLGTVWARASSASSIPLWLAPEASPAEACH